MCNSDNVTLNDKQFHLLLACLLPEPNKDTVLSILKSERDHNPYNDFYKPKLHTEEEIKCRLRHKTVETLIKTYNNW
jgi:hypothetical protein